jgi:hypothetical protein
MADEHNRLIQMLCKYTGSVVLGPSQAITAVSVSRHTQFVFGASRAQLGVHEGIGQRCTRSIYTVSTAIHGYEFKISANIVQESGMKNIHVQGLTFRGSLFRNAP